jgi:hypothetical protein
MPEQALCWRHQKREEGVSQKVAKVLGAKEMGWEF